MFGTDWLSWLNHRSRARKAARPGRRKPLSRPTARPSLTQLEDRCVLSSSILGTETLVNDRTGGNQELAQNGDRSVGVATDGTAVVAWSNESKGIIARLVGLDGAPVGG